MSLGYTDLERNVLRNTESAFHGILWGLLRIFPTDIFKVVIKVWKDVGNHRGLLIKLNLRETGLTSCSRKQAREISIYEKLKEDRIWIYKSTIKGD